MSSPAPTGLAAFDKLYEHSADSVLILDERGRTILDANPRAAEMMGLSRSDLISKDIADYLARDLAELTAFANAIHNHGVVWTDTFSLPAIGSKTQPVDVSASGFSTPAGNFIMLVMHESLESPDEEARTVQRTADLADYYKDRMAKFERDVLNNTAHDIRTPITPMLIQLAVLERSLGPLLAEDDRKSITLIRRNIERLEEHVQSVLRAATSGDLRTQ